MTTTTPVGVGGPSHQRRRHEQRHRHDASPVQRTRRLLLIAGVGLIVWAILRSRSETGIYNAGGWTNFWSFWKAAGSPELAGEFLRLTARSAATTASFAVLGTAAAVTIGTLAAPLLSRSFWEIPSGGPHRTSAVRVWLQRCFRLLALIPRSIHEVIWAILLAQVYGTAPVVAVIAIAAQFGGVTAAVFADILDDADPKPYESLRTMGAGRISALLYATVPQVTGELVSYGFYRFECAIRSAAILGVVGAGGLGYQLDLSFQTLRYSEMWTLIIALMLLSGIADWWSSATRSALGAASRRCGDLSWAQDSTQPLGTSRQSGFMRKSAFVALLSVPLAWWWAKLDIGVLFESRRLQGLKELAAELLSPHLPPGGWTKLVSAAFDTVAMSILAIAISTVIALVVGPLAARTSKKGALGRLTKLALRTWMLLLRAVPVPLWAFILIFIFFPGVWPGALALGIYNAGVLGRLFQESYEELDRRPAESIAAFGAGRWGQFLYGSWPTFSSRVIALGAYRWEVITRETIVVGVVGAAGLGRLIQEDLVARDFGSISASIVALLVITWIGSAITTAARRTIR